MVGTVKTSAATIRSASFSRSSSSTRMTGRPARMAARAAGMRAARSGGGREVLLWNCCCRNMKRSSLRKDWRKSAPGHTQTSARTPVSWHIARISASSFIRTVTVGPGFAPGLLTLRNRRRSRARPMQPGIPPVGNFTPPRRRTEIITWLVHRLALSAPASRSTHFKLRQRMIASERVAIRPPLAGCRPTGPGHDDEIFWSGAMRSGGKVSRDFAAHHETAPTFSIRRNAPLLTAFLLTSILHELMLFKASLSR